MEQAILAMLGIIITLMLYLDRGRRGDIVRLRSETNEGFKEVRADNAQLRSETNEGLAQLRSETNEGFKEVRADNARLRSETNEGLAQLRSETNEGFKWVHMRLDKLTDVVMDLCRRVGRMEGRAEASESNPDAPH